MRDLKKESGLSIYLKDDFKLDLDIKLLGGEFSSRTIRDMSCVLKDKIEINDEPLYFMYRNIRQRTDDKKILKSGLRYDLTVLLPRMIGSEFNKTYGHYHPIKEGTDFTYTEVYEVISGTALYLLQKPGKGEDEIEEAYLVEAKSGEKTIIPPNFGHITINPLSSPLVLSNWVACKFSAEYELFEKNRGGIYYFVKDDKGTGWKTIQNRRYKSIPKLNIVRPKELPRLAIEFGKPMYQIGIKTIDKLEYLTNPEKYASLINPEAIFIAKK